MILRESGLGPMSEVLHSDQMVVDGNWFASTTPRISSTDRVGSESSTNKVDRMRG